tara:strand:+ start:426 stop:635 length:210 start_codon:yes stop_codon:yes gene_type:complete
MSNIKKWEYTSVYVNREDYIKGLLGKSFKPDEFNTLLNEFGSEGWELVGVAFNDGAGGNSVLAFKRELE